MGECHLVVREELEDVILGVAKILTKTPYDNAFLYRIETPLLPAGYHGVQCMVLDGDEVSFKKDEDV